MRARRKERVQGKERAKAAFLAAYRDLCTAHGYMIIFVVQDGAYSHFAAARQNHHCLRAPSKRCLSRTPTTSWRMMPTERRIPPGKPLAWTEAEMDALSQVSPQDIAEAQAAWRKDAPRGFAGLLDAVVE